MPLSAILSADQILLSHSPLTCSQSTTEMVANFSPPRMRSSSSLSSSHNIKIRHNILKHAKCIHYLLKRKLWVTILGVTTGAFGEISNVELLFCTNDLLIGSAWFLMLGTWNWNRGWGVCVQTVSPGLTYRDMMCLNTHHSWLDRRQSAHYMIFINFFHKRDLALGGGGHSQNAALGREEYFFQIVTRALSRKN